MEGVAASVKSGGICCAFTAKLVVAVDDNVPLDPDIVIVKVPTGVLPVVVIVSVELPLPVIVIGEKLAVAPVGSPLALSAIDPENPATEVVLTV